MTTTDIQPKAADAFADSVFAAVQDFCAKEFARRAEELIPEIVNRLAAQLQPGPMGEPGKDGKAGDAGAPGLDGGPGEKGDPGAPGERGEPGQPGERGLDGGIGDKGDKGDPGMDGMPGVPGQDGREGRDGRNGAPGRDAAELEVLGSIDERKSYQRGTFATHKGGLWRAADTTDGMDGWVCVTRGVDREEEAAEDSGRIIKRRTIYSDGQVFEREIKTAAMVYRGLFSEARAYEPGDATTWGGSVWHCEEPTSEKPGTGCKAWRLAVKRGNDARLKD